MSNAMTERYLRHLQNLRQLFNCEKMLTCMFKYETQQSQNETSKQSQKSNCQMLNKYCIHKTDSFANNYRKRLMIESKIDFVWMLRLCKIYFKNICKNADWMNYRTRNTAIVQNLSSQNMIQELWRIHWTVLRQYRKEKRNSSPISKNIPTFYH